MNLKERTLIISDWSGVISDDRRPVYEANMRVIEKHGLQRLTFEQWLPRTQLSAREFFANMGLKAEGDSLFEEYAQALAEVRTSGIHPTVYPDAKDFLEKVLGARKEIVVVSAHPADHLLREANEYGLTRYVSEFIGNAKDKVVAIEQVLAQKKISRSLSAYMGDTIYDILAAKKCEVASIAVATGYHIKERLFAESPDLLVSSLTELVEYLI
jgi:phosphoglycolate phosphatase-like HAD superfamily hydrolase